jgi:hypothetical protein
VSAPGDGKSGDWKNGTWEEIDALLGAMEELQSGKVIALARRLKPGLTLEDVKNPHDFPELGDPDWHYEDGVLTGIQSIRTALRARGRIDPLERIEGTEHPDGSEES